MNKAELIQTLSEQTGQAQEEVLKTVNALLDTIGATLSKGDKLLLVGFGTFETYHRSARPGRNPQTGEPIEISEAVLPKFSPGKFLKDRVAEAHKPKEPPPKAKKAPAKAKAVKEAPAKASAAKESAVDKPKAKAKKK